MENTKINIINKLEKEVEKTHNQAIKDSIISKLESIKKDKITVKDAK